jgi:hypothetical protein
MAAGVIYGYVAGTIVGILCIIDGVSGKHFFVRRRLWWMPEPLHRFSVVLCGLLLLAAVGSRMAGIW